MSAFKEAHKRAAQELHVLNRVVEKKTREFNEMGIGRDLEQAAMERKAELAAEHHRLMEKRAVPENVQTFDQLVEAITRVNEEVFELEEEIEFKRKLYVEKKQILSSYQQKFDEACARVRATAHEQSYWKNALKQPADDRGRM